MIRSPGAVRLRIATILTWHMSFYILLAGIPLTQDRTAYEFR